MLLNTHGVEVVQLLFGRFQAAASVFLEAVFFHPFGMG